MLLPFVFMRTGSEASADEREGKTVVRKGARGPCMLRIFFFFVVVSFFFVDLQTNQATLQLRTRLSD